MKPDKSGFLKRIYFLYIKRVIVLVISYCGVCKSLLYNQPSFRGAPRRGTRLFL